MSMACPGFVASNQDAFQPNEAKEKTELYIYCLLEKAASNYQRDDLWVRLVKPALPENHCHKQAEVENVVTLEEFERCLGLSEVIDIGDLDVSLKELRKLSLNWYPLLGFLESEYNRQFRQLKFENRLDLVLSCPGVKDLMIHVQYDTKLNEIEVEFALVWVFYF